MLIIKVTYKYEKNPLTWFLDWKTMNFIHFIYQFNQIYGINARGFLILQHFFGSCKGCWGIWLSSVTVSFWLQWLAGTVRQSWNTRFPTHPAKKFKMENLCYNTNYDRCKIPGHDTQGLGRFVGTHRLRPNGLRSGYWQTCLGLGYHYVPVFTDLNNLYIINEGDFTRCLLRLYSILCSSFYLAYVCVSVCVCVLCRNGLGIYA